MSGDVVVGSVVALRGEGNREMKPSLKRTAAGCECEIVRFMADIINNVHDVHV